jgi:outer membrane protein assembly factor BamB
VLSEGLLFLTTEDGNLHAFDGETGAERWSHNVHGKGLIAAEGAIYVAGTDGAIRALEGRTAAEKWRFRTRGALTSLPILRNGVIYAGTAAGRLHAIDSLTGAEKWFVESEPDIFANHFGPKVLYEILLASADQNAVYYWSGFGQPLIAVDSATHQRRWKYSPTNSANNISAAVSAAGGRVFVPTMEDLVSLDAATGQERWSIPAGFISGAPLLVGETLYYAELGGALHAIDAAKGKEQWRAFGKGFVSAPAFLDGVLYVVGGAESSTILGSVQSPDVPASGGGWVMAVDSKTGRTLWTYEVKESSFQFAPCVGPSTLYAVTKTGVLLALR